MPNSFSNAVRFLSADMVEAANSGHPGLPMGMAEVVTVLWSRFLKYDATTPNWPDRDRFILSGGHGSAMLYSLLYLSGFPDISLPDLKRFRQMGSKTAGHPEKELLQGVEVSTGPLGQGLANAVGMAIAEKSLNARFGHALVNHKTYVTVGDGDLMEGIAEEAISLAGHLKLNKLIVLWDNNGITIDGTTQLATSTDMLKRFEANGWLTLSCNGNNSESVKNVLAEAQNSDKPVFIACQTIIGFGAPHKEGSSKVHGAPLGADELQAAKKRLDWNYGPFSIPEEVLNAWRAFGVRGQEVRLAWEKELKESDKKEEFLTCYNKELNADFEKSYLTFKAGLLEKKDSIATRKASLAVLNECAKLIPFLMEGSADLAGSCFTKTENATAISATDFSGNYINYGIREHAMGAIMNGLAAHGGFLPLGSTFMTFMDYVKPALRCSALMGLQVFYVFTHDSIGVGEDGPTHQPVEQMPTLRATPNILLFRPADIVETAESYEIAIQTKNKPSVFALSRQNLPLLRNSVTENKTAFGGYVLSPSTTEAAVTLIATGSEVALAMSVKENLTLQGIAVQVVSMPCTQLFDMQPAEYKQQVLGTGLRVAIEAASPFGWEKYTGCDGMVFGVDKFGISAPASAVYTYCGLTSESITSTILRKLKK